MEKKLILTGASKVEYLAPNLHSDLFSVWYGVDESGRDVKVYVRMVKEKDEQTGEYISYSERLAKRRLKKP